MENDEMRENITINEIGNIAQMLDKELTVLERMKLKKGTLIRLIGALFVYLIMMFLFSIFL